MALPVFHDVNRDFSGKSIIDILAECHFLDNRPPIVVWVDRIGNDGKSLVEHSNIHCSVTIHQCQFPGRLISLLDLAPSSGHFRSRMRRVRVFVGRSIHAVFAALD